MYGPDQPAFLVHQDVPILRLTKFSIITPNGGMFPSVAGLLLEHQLHATGRKLEIDSLRRCE